MDNKGDKSIVVLDYGQEKQYAELILLDDKQSVCFSTATGVKVVHIISQLSVFEGKIMG